LLTAVDNTLSELEKITAHLITNLNILIHLQILAAAVAELERGPRGGDIILIHATDLMRLVHELSQITDVEKHRESLMTIETSVKYVIELDKPQNHIYRLLRLCNPDRCCPISIDCLSGEGLHSLCLVCSLTIWQCGLACPFHNIRYHPFYVC